MISTKPAGRCLHNILTHGSGCSLPTEAGQAQGMIRQDPHPAPETAYSPVATAYLPL